jgi:hypothetical protein
MTSGAKTPRLERARLAVALALALLSGLPAAGAAPSLELPALMQALAQRGSGQARFTEVRFIQGLAAPLRSAGTLSYKAPDQLARRTTWPRPELFEVQGNQLTLERSGRVRRLQVDAVPELAALVAALSGVLNGNAQQLGQHFEVVASGSLAQWSLQLTPRHERLGRLVREMRLSGRHADLLELELHLADGDRSVMQIEPTPP